MILGTEWQQNASPLLTVSGRLHGAIVGPMCRTDDRTHRVNARLIITQFKEFTCFKSLVINMYSDLRGLSMLRVQCLHHDRIFIS